MATETLKGIEHIECTVCGNLLKTREVSVSGETIVDLSSVVGTRFSADASTLIAANLNAVPHTFEAMVQIPKSMSERAGVIMGNYGLACDTRLNIEAYTYGRIRLYFIANGNKVDHIFNTDIRSDSLTHIAVTVDGNIAKLYVNGELAETATIEYTYSAIPQNFKVGGDNRTGNSQYFKGKLYSANVFSDVRTENEIKRDCILVDENADSLLFGKYFKKQEEKVETKLLTTKGKTFNSATLFEMPSIQKGIATIEATVVGNEGVIVGNYSENASNYMNLELVEGNVKLSYATDGNSVEHIFSPEVPANEPTHIAVTMDTSASLYINGVLMETVTLEADAPSMLETMKLGGDNRSGNTAYFKGSIFSAALFSEIRSSEEIYADMLAVPSESDEVIYSGSFVKSDAEVNISAQNGQIFSEDMSVSVEKLEKAPVIFDATVKIPTDFDERAGVIIGNYSDSGDQINLEVYTDGRVRLYATKGTRTIKQVFSTDIRSDEQTRVSLVAEGRTATLYVNGEKKETVTLAFTLPDITEGFKIGGDNRTGNAQYFKGTIYSVNLYGDNKAEELLFSKEFKANEAELVLGVTPTGKTFNNTDNFGIGELDNAPVTFEAVVNVPKNISERAGVIVGNYDNSASEQFNLEISQNGTVRAVVITNGKKYYYAFSKDIRSQGPSHIVLTASGEYLTLYVNGVKIESKPLATNFPKITDNFKIGGDNRLGNTQYFKGTIYSVNLFDEVRTAGEIAEDMIAVSEGEEGLLYSGTFTNVSLDSSFNENDGKVFSAGNQISVQTLAETPQTFEAILTVPKDIDDRAGTIIGNYDGGNGAQVNIEAYSGGKIRLFMHNGSFKSKVAFGTDIRSDEPTHIAITVDGKLATLYVNGTKAETVRLLTELPEMRENIKIGGDNRTKGDATFKGKLYAIALFSDIRTDAQIKEDYASVNDNEEGLLYLRSFTEDSCHANLTDTKHIESEWIIDAVQTVTEQGMKHTECELCSKVITVALTDALKEENQTVDYADSGITFEEQEDVVSVDTLKSAPKTFEAVLNLPTSVTSRAGVIIGNYDNSVKDQFNLEIYTNGNPRIYYKAAKKAYSHVFKTDVRSDTVTRLAITIDGLTVKLYLNGVLKETVTLTVAIPSITEGYKIGADNRAENPQFFKGTIYAVNVFEDVRTDEEIKTDAIMVTRDTAGLAYSKYFSVISEEQQKYPYNLEGKVIVNFGDSIFGNYKAPVDISTYISEKTGATAYNVGFGSAQMSENSTAKYEPFGMKNLADAITTGDWTTQNAVINSGNAPVAYKRCLPTLQSIDFNNVDIITIAYGTNDFKNGKSLEEVGDALRYSIETISKKYPNIQIVLCTPVYRFWLDDNGNFVEDSTTKEINGIKLTDYIELYKNIADEYNLFVIDNYNYSGINAANRNECFTGTDTTHPNETGRQMIAENMAKELYNYFG